MNPFTSISINVKIEEKNNEVSQLFLYVKKICFLFMLNEFQKYI